MPKVMTLGRTPNYGWRMSMRQTVDPILYAAGQPMSVSGLGANAPGEPFWNMPGGWGPRPPAYATDNFPRPTSGGAGLTDPRTLHHGVGALLRGSTKLGVGALAQATEPMSDVDRGAWLIWSGLGVVGGALGVYHGYKRNNSIGWGIWWGLMGSMFPIITLPLAFAQGFGKRKGR